MLYGNQSISHFTRSNQAIWMLMSFQAGILNIGGFLAGHQIVSHVTGFATNFGSDLSKGVSPWRYLLVPIFFLLGSMVSGYFVDLRLKLKKKPRYYITFTMMFLLICSIWLLGVFGVFGSFGNYEELPSRALLILLCFTCGLQNGTISTVSRSVVRTTHLTGVTTDLGLGIVRILNRKKLDDRIIDEGKANIMRIGIIFFFTLGAVVGGYLFSHFEFHGFLLPVFISGGLLWLMIYYQVIKSVGPKPDL